MKRTTLIASALFAAVSSNSFAQGVRETVEITITGGQNPGKPDAKKAASGTGEFMITVGFGPLMSRSATYTVDTTKGKKSGSGTVTVDDKGSTAKVKFSASTPEGVKLEGTIDCKSVTRAG